MSAFRLRYFLALLTSQGYTLTFTHISYVSTLLLTVAFVIKRILYFFRRLPLHGQVRLILASGPWQPAGYPTGPTGDVKG